MLCAIRVPPAASAAAAVAFGSVVLVLQLTLHSTQGNQGPPAKSNHSEHTTLSCVSTSNTVKPNKQETKEETRRKAKEEGLA